MVVDEQTVTKQKFTFRNLWIRPTGNCKPAFTEREVGLRLSPFFDDIVPLAPLPERPLPESPFAPLPDILNRRLLFYLFVSSEALAHTTGNAEAVAAAGLTVKDVPKRFVFFGQTARTFVMVLKA